MQEKYTGIRPALGYSGIVEDANARCALFAWFRKTIPERMKYGDHMAGFITQNGKKGAGYHSILAVGGNEGFLSSVSSRLDAQEMHE